MRFVTDFVPGDEQRDQVHAALPVARCLEPWLPFAPSPPLPPRPPLPRALLARVPSAV